MLGLWHSNAQWSIRQLPRVHAAFAQLYQTEQLWVEVDCVNLKPPCHDAHPGWGGQTYLHWDWDLAAEGLGVQGALYLADTSIDGGGFRCMPGWVTSPFSPSHPLHRGPYGSEGAYRGPRRQYPDSQ